MAILDSSPRASAGVSVGIPQMLTLADGTSFPPGCCAIPWGCASGPVGLAPEALQERECSCKVFSQSAGVLGVSFSRHRQYPSRPRQCHAHVFDIRLHSVHHQEVYPCVEPPSLGPFEAIGALRLVCTLPRRPSAGRRVRFPQLPSSGSRIVDSSLSCYRMIEVDAHAPFDKGRLVV
jgi:hypothetical protein